MIKQLDGHVESTTDNLSMNDYNSHTLSFYLHDLATWDALMQFFFLFSWPQLSNQLNFKFSAQLSNYTFGTNFFFLEIGTAYFTVQVHARQIFYISLSTVCAIGPWTPPVILCPPYIYWWGIFHLMRKKKLAYHYKYLKRLV